MYDEKFQEFSSIGKNMNKLFNYFILLQLPSSEEIYFLRDECPSHLQSPTSSSRKETCIRIEFAQIFEISRLVSSRRGVEIVRPSSNDRQKLLTPEGGREGDKRAGRCIRSRCVCH